MKAKMQIIHITKRSTDVIAAAYRGNFNFTLSSENKGTSNMENKKANKIGVIISFAV